MGVLTSSASSVIQPGTTTITLLGTLQPVGDTDLTVTTLLFNNYVNNIPSSVNAVVPSTGGSTIPYISIG